MIIGYVTNYQEIFGEKIANQSHENSDEKNNSI